MASREQDTAVAATPPRPPRARRLVVLVVSGVVALVALDLAFRLLAPALGLQVPARARLLLISSGAEKYESHPYTVYRLNTELPGVNSLGFRDRECRVEREPGTRRIACLGASTTYGYHLDGAEQAFPRQLEYELGQLLDGEFEVLNFGVPAWTSAEVMTNYLLTVQDFAPDVVVIHLAFNDIEPRTRLGFRSDYAHYRRSYTSDRVEPPNRLLINVSALYGYFYFHRHIESLQERVEREEGERRSVPLDLATAEPFRRNVSSICEHVTRHGGRPVLMTMPWSHEQAREWPHRVQGLKQHNRVLRQLGAERSTLLVDLASEWDERVEELAPRFRDIVHVDAEGHRAKARDLAAHLVEAGVFGERE